MNNLPPEKTPENPLALLIAPLLAEPTQIPEINTSKAFTVKKAREKVTFSTKGANWVAVLDSFDQPVAADDSSNESITVSLSRGDYKVCSDGEIKKIQNETADKIEDPLNAGSLLVTTDAPDVHVVDGIGEIPADGKSHCTVSVTLVNSAGNPQQDGCEVFLRTTGGMLQSSATARGKVIRQLKLKKGKGSFVVISDQTPRVVTISLLSTSMPTQTLQLEFTPI